MSVVATFKKKKNEALGLGIKKIAGKDGLYISVIQPGGKIATAAKQLKVGMQLIALNEKACPATVPDALAILKNAKGKLKIVAKVPVVEADDGSHSDSRSYDSRDSRSYSSRSYDSRDSRSYSDSRSYDSRDSRSYRTGDSRSYRTGDSRSYRTGDSRSYRTGDSRSYRTGDSRSSRTGDSRSSRNGDSRSYRTGDSQRSPRSADSRSIYSNDERSRHADERSGLVETRDNREEEKIEYEMDEVDPGEDRCRTMIVEIWVLAKKEKKATALKAASSPTPTMDKGVGPKPMAAGAGLVPVNPSSATKASSVAASEAKKQDPSTTKKESNHKDKPPKSLKKEEPNVAPVKKEKEESAESKEEQKGDSVKPASIVPAQKAEKAAPAKSESVAQEKKPEAIVGNNTDKSNDGDDGKNEEPETAPQKEMSLNERRLAITAILKDDSLTGPEKQERIKALRPPPRARRAALAQQTGGVESEAAIRRKAIQVVHADKTLTPKEKHTRIQELIKGNK